MTETPFWEWSIAEAWGWLINVPYLGFAGLAILGLIVLLGIVTFWLISEGARDY